MTQFCKQRSFQRFHFFGFVVIYMVVAQQMQAAVNHQMGPVGLKFLALFSRFALDHRNADHQVPQQWDIQQLIRYIGRK